MKNLHRLLEPLPFIEEEASRQATWFRSWSSDEWNLPTFCEDWLRKHIVAHSTFGAIFYEEVIRLGIQGNPNPPFGATNREGFIEIRENAMNRMLGLSMDHLSDEFEIEYNRFQHTASSLHLDDLQSLAWHPMGQLPVGHFVGMRLFELAIHDWDIRVSSNTKAGLRKNLLTPLLQALPFMHIRFLNHRPAATAPSGTYRFIPKEAASWGISIQRGIADLSDSSQNHAEVTGEGEAFIFHTTGRKSWEKAEREQLLSINGKRKQMEELLAALAVTY